MYLKLKDIRLQRIDNSEDRFILAEVPDSPMSYEAPIIVRRQEELDIWFGSEFEDYNYFSELISSGVSLFLYRPVKTEEIIIPGYVDIDDYQEHQGEYSNPSMLPREGDPDFNPNEKYRVGQPPIDWSIPEEVVVIGESLPDNPDPYPNTKYKMGDAWYTYLNSSWYCSSDLPGSYYIWLWESWVSEYDLPQNIEKSTISQNNRDTLLIPRKGYTGNIGFCYPEYKEGTGLLDYQGPESKYSNMRFSNVTAVPQEGNWSCVTDFEYQESTLPLFYYLVLPYYYKTELETNDFIRIYYNLFDHSSEYTIKDVTDLPEEPEENTIYRINGVMWYFDSIRWLNEIEAGKELSRTNIGRSVEINDNGTWEDLKETIIDVLGDNTNNAEDKGDLLSIYSVCPIPTTYDYYFPGLSFSYNQRETQNFITSKLDKSNWGIEIWSKTIGRGDPDYSDDLISVQIQELKAGDTYRFTITRFDYSEVFEGTLNPNPGERRLDYTIDQESKLIHLRFNDITGGLKTGTWKLVGAEKEEYNPEMYWKALDMMMYTKTISPDYLLVPNKNNWTENISDQAYQEKLLEYARENNFQVLIQNNLPEYAAVYVDKLPEWSEEIPDYILYITEDNRCWISGESGYIEETNFGIIERAINGGDFIYNYLGDKDNYLVFFYQDMTRNGLDRPGYYMYLLGLLQDIYSLSTTMINYNCPTQYPYSDSEFEERLSRYKSNYITWNNQIYYYKDYQNGENYNSTAWMRFAIERISRDLMRKRYSYLGKRSEVEIRRNIENILNNIVWNFSIIGNIEVEEFNFNLREYRLELKLKTNVRDLVDNNIELDITINYNE